jgi:hypothetical protein
MTIPSAEPADDATGTPADIAEAERIVDQCRTLFAGHEAGIQGAALADLLATWLAGHPPPMREKLLELHVEGVRALIPHNDPWPPNGKLDD